MITPGWRGKAGIPAAIMAAAVLLLWPAALNGYPLLFSDTGAFLSQGLDWFMVWDKPWIYGPVLGWSSLKLTLWLPVIGQGLLLSWLLWRVLAALRCAQPMIHVGLCATLALGSAVPWFASLLMADIFAPIAVLCLFLIAFGARRGRAVQIGLAAFAIATHLAHLVVAALVLALVVAMRPRAVLRTAAPLVLALLAVAAGNAVGHGRVAVSPYGSVFLLARLVADGPARDYLHRACPDAGYALCGWVGRLPTDSDQFMWDPKGPVWSQPGGPPGLAPEASAILRGTFLSDPLGVAGALAANTVRQLVLLHLDEMLGNYWLDETVGERLRRHFPAGEYQRFRASHQLADTLRPFAAPWQVPHAVLLALAAMGCVVTPLLARRRQPRLAAFALLVLASVLANAFATGALSGPHDRYQARIAWLLFLPPLLYATMRATASGAERTRDA